MAIYRDVGGRRVVWRSVDLTDPAPLWQIFGSNVRPGLAAIPRKLDQTVVRACPDQVFGHRRFCDRKDGVVVFGTGVVLINGAAGDLLLALVVAGQVRTDGLPVHAAIGGLKQALAGVVKSIRIVRRNQNGRSPLEAVFQNCRPAAVADLGLLRDVLDLTGTFVKPRDNAFVLAGVHNIWIGWIGRDEARFTSTHVIPVGTVDRTLVAAAGDGY